MMAKSSRSICGVVLFALGVVACYGAPAGAEDVNARTAQDENSHGDAVSESDDSYQPFRPRRVRFPVDMWGGDYNTRPAEALRHGFRATGASSRPWSSAVLKSMNELPISRFGTDMHVFRILFMKPHEQACITVLFDKNKSAIRYKKCVGGSLVDNHAWRLSEAQAKSILTRVKSDDLWGSYSAFAADVSNAQTRSTEPARQGRALTPEHHWICEETNLGKTRDSVVASEVGPVPGLWSALLKMVNR